MSERSAINVLNELLSDLHKVNMQLTSWKSTGELFLDYRTQYNNAMSGLTRHNTKHYQIQNDKDITDLKNTAKSLYESINRRVERYQAEIEEKALLKRKRFEQERQGADRIIAKIETLKSQFNDFISGKNSGPRNFFNDNSVAGNFRYFNGMAWGQYDQSNILELQPIKEECVRMVSDFLNEIKEQEEKVLQMQNQLKALHIAITNFEYKVNKIKSLLPGAQKQLIFKCQNMLTSLEQEQENINCKPIVKISDFAQEVTKTIIAAKPQMKIKSWHLLADLGLSLLNALKALPIHTGLMQRSLLFHERYKGISQLNQAIDELETNIKNSAPDEDDRKRYQP